MPCRHRIHRISSCSKDRLPHSSNSSSSNNDNCNNCNGKANMTMMANSLYPQQATFLQPNRQLDVLLETLSSLVVPSSFQNEGVASCQPSPHMLPSPLTSSSVAGKAAAVSAPAQATMVIHGTIPSEELLRPITDDIFSFDSGDEQEERTSSYQEPVLTASSSYPLEDSKSDPNKHFGGQKLDSLYDDVVTPNAATLTRFMFSRQDSQGQAGMPDAAASSSSAPLENEQDAEFQDLLIDPSYVFPEEENQQWQHSSTATTSSAGTSVQPSATTAAVAAAATASSVAAFRHAVSSSSMASSSCSTTSSTHSSSSGISPNSSCSEYLVTSTHDQLWQSRYKELQDFHRKHGHALVPMNWEENQTLAHWVKRQRHQYKVKHALRTGAISSNDTTSTSVKMTKTTTTTTGRVEDGSSLTDQREAALQALGFVWDSHSAAWEERWNELADYERQHGHTNVPKNYAPNQKLSVWVKCQRRQYKLMNQGKRSNMTPYRINKLRSLGFCFYPRRAERQQFWMAQQQQQQQLQEQQQRQQQQQVQQQQQQQQQENAVNHQQQVLASAAYDQSLSSLDMESLEKKNLARKKFGLKPLTPEEFLELQEAVSELDSQQKKKASAAAEMAKQQKKQDGGFFNKLFGEVMKDTCETNFDCSYPEVCCDFGFKKMCCSSGMRILDGPPKSREGQLAEIPVVANPGPFPPDDYGRRY
mmetsp:Transcript_7507/g.13155  ORF Transcript_7507/g.13155 Transcript_7507/m.13155 type:complete len:701 (+) Transcript_7507:468-2570(+)